jgi:hypothetical protein
MPMDSSDQEKGLEGLHIPAEIHESDHIASQSNTSTTQNPQNTADTEYSHESDSPSISPDIVDYVSYPDIEVDTDVGI